MSKLKADTTLGTWPFKFGSVSVSWQSGQLVGALSLSSGPFTGSLILDLSAVGALDLLKGLITDPVVDEIITVIQTALAAT